MTYNIQVTVRIDVERRPRRETMVIVSKQNYLNSTNMIFHRRFCSALCIDFKEVKRTSTHCHVRLNFNLATIYVYSCLAYWDVSQSPSININGRQFVLIVYLTKGPIWCVWVCGCVCVIHDLG